MIRFVVDDGCFLSAADLDVAEFDDGAFRLAELLSGLRGQGHTVGFISGWGNLPVSDTLDLASLLTGSSGDRETRIRLLGLLDKCVAWDLDMDIFLEPAVEIGGIPWESYGVAYAADQAAKSSLVGIVEGSWTPFEGVEEVAFGDLRVPVPFLIDICSLPIFHRARFAVEGVQEHEFFDVAAEAFPRLLFHPSLNFGGFEGSYLRRDEVVRHLSALNDHFIEIYRQERGNGEVISTRLGVSMSIEGDRTRSSGKLLAQREVIFEGKRIRCEWHTKLDPYRNRIHFAIVEGSPDRVLIGKFVEHLDT